ncbi:MAG: hypothetical protein EOP24_33595 [Hyphomicrobiales bacterium]|nr:MAG: hypothetical protein EOP24_33595 [Hyphomicrobiales bacterium]
MSQEAPLSRARKLGLGLVFIWFFVGSVGHFVLTDLELRMVPPWVPWPREAVLATGVLELLGALGILWRPVRRAAGWGLVLLTIAVTPANVFMLQHAADFPRVPHWVLVARLPLQAALLALIIWSTARPKSGSQMI